VAEPGQSPQHPPGDTPHTATLGYGRRQASTKQTTYAAAAKTEETEADLY
jgi:hypothetical protein